MIPVSAPMGTVACTIQNMKKCTKHIKIGYFRSHLFFHPKGVRIDYVDQGSISGGHVSLFLGVRSPQPPSDHIGVVITMGKSLHLLRKGEILKSIV